MFEKIAGFNNQYQINTEGQIKNSKDKILSQSISNSGYYRVHLCKDGKAKWYAVHKLVAQTFIPNPLHLPEVNHKDENKLNNNVDNLEWCNSKYNTNYGARNKRISETKTNNTYNTKQVLCVETSIIYPSIMEAQRQTGIFNTAIGKVCKGERKTAGHYHWVYINNKERRKS